MRKVEKINELRGDVHVYVAQGIRQIDAEIAQKGRFWTETRLEAEKSGDVFTQNACLLIL